MRKKEGNRFNGLHGRRKPLCDDVFLLKVTETRLAALPTTTPEETVETVRSVA
jgi:hypothetical protein